MKRRWIVPLLLAVAAIGVGVSLTGEEAHKVQRINAAGLRVENVGCETMELNPLREEDNPAILQTITDYYDGQRDAADFIEAYDNIRVYTKAGKGEGTYVAFVKYEMKIKDIYTKVPGLGTLYLKQDGTGSSYEVDTGAKENGIREYLARISRHEDVQALLDETGNEYTEAVQSDALLQEALLDLKNAYEDSTGS